MSEPVNTAHERITTVDDGPDTVNERMTTGGPGPEGQLDTVHERLSGSQSESEPVEVEQADAVPETQPEG